jgi:hypothetical protein
LDFERSGDEIAVTVDDAPGALAMLRESGHPPRVVDLNLDEIFEAFVAGRQDTQDAAASPEVATPSV